MKTAEFHAREKRRKRLALDYLSGADEFAQGRYGSYSWKRNIQNTVNINFNLPFWRTVEGVDHTLFVIDIDIFNVTDKETKVLCATHVVFYILDKFPIQDWFVKFSGSSFHMEQKYPERINPEAFRPVLEWMFSNWMAGSDVHPDDKRYRRMLVKTFEVEGLTFEAGIDLSLTDRRHIISAPYSEYAKEDGYYVYPIFDMDLLDNPREVLHHAKFKDLALRAFEMPAFGFEEHLGDNKEIESQATVRTKARKRQAIGRTAKRQIAQIPKTKETEFHLQKMETLIQSSDWLCIREALRRSRDERGVFFERAPIARFLWWNYKKDVELIAHYFFWNVNDEQDRIRWSRMEHGMNYALFNPKGEQKSQDTWQSANIQRNQLCVIGCSAPCRKFIWNMSEVKPIRNFRLTKKLVDRVLDSEENTVIKKTTRAGVTTSTVLLALKRGKKVLGIVPTNAIARETFYNISILAHQQGIMFSGAVIGENTKVCLKCMKEIEKAREEFSITSSQLIAVERLPFMLKEQCLTTEGEQACEHWNDVYTDGVVINERGIPTPVIESRIDPDRCAFATILRNIQDYNVIFLTYDKLRLIFHQTEDNERLSEERGRLIDELEANFDIVLLDEISRFINTPSTDLPIFIERYKMNKDRELLEEKEVSYNIFEHVRNLEGSERETWLGILNQRGKNPDRDLINKVLVNFDVHAQNIVNQFESKTWGKIPNPMAPNLRRDVQEKFKEWYSMFVEHAKNFNIFFPNILKVMEVVNQPTNNWFITNIPRGRETHRVEIKITPFYDDVINFVRMCHRRNKQVIVTDATLPYVEMEDIFEIPFKKVNLGDPRKTSQIQLVIPDTTNIYPSMLLLGKKDSVFKQDLVELINAACRAFGSDDVMLIAQNKDVWSLLISFYEKGMIPSELDISTNSKQVTYYRSGATIGVENKRRTLIVIGNPYPPKDAYTWLANVFRERGFVTEITEEELALRLWRKEAASAFQQSIGRVKDPFTAIPSVILCYGVSEATIKNLTKSETDEIRVVDGVVEKNYQLAVEIGVMFKKCKAITCQTAYKTLRHVQEEMKKEIIEDKDLPFKLKDSKSKVFSTPQPLLECYGLELAGKRLKKVVV